MNKSQWWDWGCHAWPEQQSFSVTHVASWYSGPQRQRLSIQPDSSCSPTNTTGHADSQPSHPCCRSHWCVHRDWGQGVWNSPLSAVATTQSHCHARSSWVHSPQRPSSISTCNVWHPDVVSFSFHCLKAQQQTTSCWCLHFSTHHLPASLSFGFAVRRKNVIFFFSFKSECDCF